MRTNFPKHDQDEYNSNCSLKIEDNEWLTTDEAASYLRLSVPCFRNILSRGELPFYKLYRCNRYLKRELREFLLANRKGTIYDN